MNLISAFILSLLIYTPFIPVTYRYQDTFTEIQAQELHIGTYPKNLNLEYHPEWEGYVLYTAPLNAENMVLQIRRVNTGNYEIYLFPNTYEMKDWLEDSIILFDSRNQP